MPHQVIKHRLRRELRSLGVGISHLLIDVNEHRVIFSGEIAAYHELQLIQINASRFTEQREIVLNLTVVPSTITTKELEIPGESESPKVDPSRNQLNRILLGLRLVDEYLQQGDHEEAHELIREMIKNASSGAGELNSEIGNLFGRRVLVVEDDAEQCFLLSGLLRQLGGEVQHAGDVSAAFTVLNSGFIPDVALLDVHLAKHDHFPVHDGVEIARAIRERRDCGLVKIIAVSGTHPKEVGLNVESGQIDAWLPKPISIDRLLATIHRV